MDMRGDMSGFMEGYVAMMRPLLSLHHLGMPDVSLMPDRSNDQAAATVLRASVSMPTSFLRRFVLRMQQPTVTVIVTMGYSVQVRVCGGWGDRTKHSGPRTITVSEHKPPPGAAPNLPSRPPTPPRSHTYTDGKHAFIFLQQTR